VKAAFESLAANRVAQGEAKPSKANVFRCFQQKLLANGIA